MLSHSLEQQSLDILLSEFIDLVEGNVGMANEAIEERLRRAIALLCSEVHFLYWND